MRDHAVDMSILRHRGKGPTIQCCAERRPQIFKLPIGSPAEDNTSGGIQRCKIALEGDVAWLHGDSRSQTFKSSSASVMAARRCMSDGLAKYCYAPRAVPPTRQLF